MINNINNDLIKELRRRTDISIIKCKQALIKSNGNIELAIDNLRRDGFKTNVNKSSHSTPSGLIIIKLTSNKQKGLMIEINCETDFVSRNAIFQEFADKVIDTALKESISDINSLKTKFELQRIMLVNKVNENIKIRRFVVLTGDYLGYYVHRSKIGAIVSVSGNIAEPNIVKYIAMHIVARDPKYIYINDIAEDVLIRERHIQMDIAIRSGKSCKIAEKIVEGRIDKFMGEIVLTKQDFIMDSNRMVENILDENNIKINNFVRFDIGDDS